jgi:Holliday junction resolvase RusA-like endonuclease
MSSQRRLLSIWVEGHPAPMPRPRWQGRGGMKYSRRGSDWIAAVDAGLLTAAACSQGGRGFDGPVRLSVAFWLPTPSGGLAGPSRGPKSTHSARWATARPDIDNLTKIIADRLEHTGWIRDDSQIVVLSASKRFAPPGHTSGADITLDALLSSGIDSHGVIEAR